MELDITNNTEKRQFETIVEGKMGIIGYSLFPGGIIFDHTEVDEALEGRGIASALAKYALEYAKEQHLQVVPLCPYVNAYIRRHPEYEPLVKKT